MTDWPVPKNCSEVKGFLGLLNYYRRFIKHFARIALPLTELTKADAEKKSFLWTAAAQEAFVSHIEGTHGYRSCLADARPVTAV